MSHDTPNFQLQGCDSAFRHVNFLSFNTTTSKMPLFVLPLAPSSTTSHSQPTNTRIHSSLPIRKRKRRRLSNDSSTESVLSDNDAPPASTNPLSLTPDEIVQYRLAGLELDEEIPEVKDFPHRGLEGVRVVERQRDRKGKGKAGIQHGVEGEGVDKDREEVKRGDAGDEAQQKRAERGPRLRLQHLSVLTTILQRCLLEGDIPRASRAWAMLIRAQVGGRGIDLRGSGYWGIGAELLIRSFDQKRSYSYDSDFDSDEEEGVVKRWGTAEGLEKVRDYYERLILQYPYKRQFDSSVSALDFWPAMVGCEIYGIQFEQNEGLKRVAREEGDDEGGERSGSQSEEDEEDENDIDGVFAAQQRSKSRGVRRRAEIRWIERDEIRKTALTASEKIAARLDELMATPPYSDSHNLLRLRGMVALYVGDLSVPAMPLEEANDEDEDDESIERRRQLRSTDKATERRFLFRQRLNEHEHGKQKREEEQARARMLLDRIVREGGPVGDIEDLSLVQYEGPEDLYNAEEY